jgi:hypothetical protein
MEHLFLMFLDHTHIFKPTIGNESLHQDSNDNGVRIVNFATSKNLVVKSTAFPHRNTSGSWRGSWGLDGVGSG